MRTKRLTAHLAGIVWWPEAQALIPLEPCGAMQSTCLMSISWHHMASHESYGLCDLYVTLCDLCVIYVLADLMW